MRTQQIIAAIALATISFGDHFVAAASETGIVEQILEGSVFEASVGSPTVYFTRNGLALISIRGDSDELVQITVEDDGAIAFLGASHPEFNRQWRYDGTLQALVSFDGRLQLPLQVADRGNNRPNAGNHFGTPGCAPGHCH